MVKNGKSKKVGNENFRPTLELTSSDKLAPHIRLPNNYRELVPAFYKEGGREEMENYSERLQELLKGSELGTQVNLVWERDAKEKLTDGGLTHILTNGKSSLDLEEDEEHNPEYHGKNLNIKNYLISETIATQYIALLIRNNNTTSKENSKR